MTLKEYLKSLGMSDKALNKVLSKPIMSDIKLIRAKIEFFKKTFNFSDKEIVKIIELFPFFINLDTNSDSQTSVINKIKFYQKIFNINKEEIIKLIKKLPSLLYLDTISDNPTSVKSKIKFYMKAFNLSLDETINIIKKEPELLSYDTVSDSETSVKNKIKFYKENLELSDKQVSSLIKHLPALLGYDTNSENETSIKSKIKFYKKTFEIDNKTLGQMVQKVPSMFAYDVVSEKESSVKTKLKYLLEFATKENIIKNPILLSHPGMHVKIRYLIMSKGYLKEKIVSGSLLMTSEQKLYARARFLEDHHKSLKNLHQSEKAFKKQYKVNSGDLIKKYPLSHKVLNQLEQEHFENTGENIKISTKERNSILKTSDASEIEQE